MILEERTELLNSANGKQIVTSSPHCFDIYAKQYEGLEKEIKHYTQFVSKMIQDGDIKFNQEVTKKVTYHDPCYLGRQNKIYDEPRHILSSIPGINLIEMERSRETSLCCGGGGGRMWYEGEGEGHMSHERLREAVDLEAEVIATACPFCMNMFDDAIKTLGLGDKIEVKDIMELVAEAL
jgi:Fe-S oxidoreductase